MQTAISHQLSVVSVAFLLLSTAHCPLSTASEIRWMRVTAYCPCQICCGPNACGITASGRPAVGALVAVDPRLVKLGSMLDLPGCGWQLAADTGRVIQGNRLDLLFATHEEARRFGTRWLAVTILTRAEWRRKLEDEAMERRFAELIAASRRLADARIGGAR